MGIGGAIFEGNSKLFSGPLGVVRIGFDGYDLGKTTADAVLTPDQDIKDIMYQQEGTKPADHVRTGMEYLLDVTFGEIKTGLLTLMMAGITAGIDPDDDDGVIDRSIFQSMLDNEAKPLKIAACDENGLALAETQNIINFYHAIPIIPGELINWGVDTQRNLPVQFRLKYHKFTVTELELLSRSSGGAFGYWGDPNALAGQNLDCTALAWPDKTAPVIVSAICTSAILLLIKFNEVIALQNGFVAGHYSLKLNEDYELATAGEIIAGNGNNTLQLTFTGPFTGLTDVVEISICGDALEDSEANVYAGIDNFPCEAWDGEA